ncbi:hypothetical protein OK074_8043 [Actinobacteria bacterium OK074]|nr:hypothetical protein OK074_8043 [Actinobacteria bacterium OK074]
MAARRVPSWFWVTGLTVAAVAAVAALAVQASHGPQPHAPVAGKAPAATKASPHASAAPTAAAVPANSGSGRRIVYSLGQKRVWLVDASDKTSRTFAVWPGTVAPSPGTYAVSTRVDATTGTDGKQVQHIMYFALSSGVSIAFSNAVDGASPSPSAGARTGGIRMSVADGTALYAFGATGTSVVVVG